MQQPGTELNHYRILRQLGAGGMGEVYEADDTRLKRRVALKILPPETSADPARRARFEQEAQAVAALNHPNIVTIHSVEECNSTRFLTMEMVDGSTIDQLVPITGLPLPDLLKYALPIVDAVSAAHERGIVHRDLKPANVMVTRDGRIKVLDFGVAKLLDLSASLDTNVPTMTGRPAATSLGQIVGTAPYMSPEQAEGRPIDHRSDLFSLGILLYEMATGARPFAGETSVAVLASIVKDEPRSMRKVRAGVSPALERVVNECLEKDPARRLPSARELHRRLDALATASTSHLGRPLVGAVAGAVVIVAAVGVYALRPSARRDVDTGTPTFSRVTFESGIKMGPSISPDGREIVYAAVASDAAISSTQQTVSSRYHIFLRRLDGSAMPTDLSMGSSGSDRAPSFSPDGRLIAFASSRDGSDGIFVMTRAGADVRRLTNGGYDPSWTPDGRELVYSTESGRDPDAREAPSELWAVNVATAQKRRIASTDALDPRLSPDGRFVAFWALPVDAVGTQFASANRDVWIQPMSGGSRVQVTDAESSEWNPAWSADGRFLYFSSDRSGSMNLWRVAIDRTTGRPSGDPIAITAPSPFVGDMSIGANGVLAYSSFDYDTAVRAIAFDMRTGEVSGQPRNVVTGHRAWLQPDVSPDGSLVTLRSTRSQEDIWVVDSDGGNLRQVTNDVARDRGSRFAPDGSLLFYSARTGTYQFWSIRPDGSGLRQLTYGNLALNYPLPSPDGRFVAGTNPNTNEQLIFDAHDWTKPPERLPSPPVKGQMYLRDWSPDGKRLVADTYNTVWVFDVGARTWERVASGGGAPRWLPDGRRLVFGSSGRVAVVDTVTKRVRDIYGEPGRFVGGVALAPDGRWLYFTSSLTQSDIWTMRFTR